MKISSSFGGGIGRSREVCGTVSGMCMIAGLLQGFSDPKDENAPTKKKEHYELIQKLLTEFREENGSIICRELLSGAQQKEQKLNNKQTSIREMQVSASPIPEARTPEYYKKRPCGELCKIAADIIDRVILN